MEYVPLELILSNACTSSNNVFILPIISEIHVKGQYAQFAEKDLSKEKKVRKKGKWTLYWIRFLKGMVIREDNTNKNELQ